MHPHYDNEHTRHLIVASPDEPDSYCRYLYTFKWLNPYPERLIDTLEITALPNTAATLIVLAITTVVPAAL